MLFLIRQQNGILEVQALSVVSIINMLVSSGKMCFFTATLHTKRKDKKCLQHLKTKSYNLIKEKFFFHFTQFYTIKN